MNKRQFLKWSAMLALTSCRRNRTVVVVSTGGFRVYDWSLGGEGMHERRCVVLVPHRMKAEESQKIPLLIALHGAGETVDSVTGSFGWLKAYGLEQAYTRLRNPPLTRADYQGFVSNERLQVVNQDLAKRPLQGLVVACPYLPRAIGRALPVADYASWIVHALIPKIRAEFPVCNGPACTGIDGVSLGGMSALSIAFAQPKHFGAVGTLQPAIGTEDTMNKVIAGIEQQLHSVPVRLVTSEDDVFRGNIVKLHEKLKERATGHSFLMTDGPHDYAWNRGPGAIEMLLWHDRVLRNLPAI